ncbi:hypothetical protein [Brevundimonas sp.]|uniref:hypothetical protein n=1 Tax=Brevundimonas sp. TaxID=1871086 RepID=UPI002ED96C22
MVRLFPLQFTKAELDQIPAHHRIAFLGLGQVANETSILMRLSLGAIGSMRPPQPVSDMANATAMFALRMLAGRIWEARLFLNSAEVATAFREVCDLALRVDQRTQAEIDQATAGRAELFRQLDGPNIIRPLRNRASFHTEVALLTESYDALPEAINFVDHLDSSRGNSVYGASETLHLTALSALLKEPNYEVALVTAATEISEAVGKLGDFIDGFMVAFVIGHFGPERMRGARIEVPAVPLDELTIPLFFTHAE